MTNFMKKLMMAVTGAMLVFTPAMAADRTDCVGELTTLTENVGKAGGTVKPLDPGEISAVIAKRGPPPVAEPYTFSLAEVGENGMVAIHDGECVLGAVGPAPMELINGFLGKVGA